MRPLCAVLACSNGEFELTGEPRMEERPIGALVDAMDQAGADISYLKNKDYPPLLIKGKQLSAIHELDQLLMAVFPVSSLPLC